MSIFADLRFEPRRQRLGPPASFPCCVQPRRRGGAARIRKLRTLIPADWRFEPRQGWKGAGGEDSEEHKDDADDDADGEDEDDGEGGEYLEDGDDEDDVGEDLEDQD